MELQYRREVTVGVLVIVALAILFGGLTWLSGKSFGTSGEVMVPVLFHDVSGLAEGNPVQVSGVKVGRVSEIQLAGEDSVIVTLAVQKAWRPHADADVVVRALDAFGSMGIEYSPGTSSQMLTEGMLVPGKREGGLLETAGSVAGKANAVLTGASDLLSRQTAQDVHQTMLAAQRALDVIAKAGNGPAVAQLDSTLRSLRSLTTHLDSTVASPDLKRAVAQLDEVTGNLNEMVVNLRDATGSLAQIMTKMDQNKGTFGRMVNDTTLYVEMTKLSNSLRLLLDDIRERPGRYFNLKVF